jgi:hypothetical protein
MDCPSIHAVEAKPENLELLETVYRVLGGLYGDYEVELEEALVASYLETKYCRNKELDKSKSMRLSCGRCSAQQHTDRWLWNEHGH